MTTGSQRRTPSRPAMAGVPQRPPTKDVEAALNAYIRDEGLSFDQLALHIGVDGETLRLMLDPADRRVLGASRLLPLLRALGTPEPFNAAARLCPIDGVPHQLVPCPTRPCSGSIMADAATASRTHGEYVEAVALSMEDGRIDAVEAAAILAIVLPHHEREAAVIAQLEALARREAP